MVVALSSVTARMRPTVFLFKTGRKLRLEPNKPTEFFYGFAELRAAGYPVAMFEEAELGIEPTWPRIVEMAAGKLTRVLGAHARVMKQLDRALRGPLAAFEVLICTTQTLGMAAAALHRLGRHRKSVVTMTMGLIEPEASAFERRVKSLVFAGTTLAVLSRAESEWLRNVSDLQVQDFQFGVDLSFWSPADSSAAGEAVISIGNDWNRDFETLIAAWRNDFPPLTILTSLPITADRPNVKVERSDWRSAVISDEALRTRLRRARFVVVPLRDTIQPSGQSAALQAMACAKPVILSANRGLWDRAQIERHRAAVLVPPGDPQRLADAIAHLLASPDEARQMGLRARAMLEEEDVSTIGMARQIATIASAT